MSDAVTIPRQWFEDLLSVCTEDRFKIQVLKAVFAFAADGTEDDTLIGDEKEMFVRMKKVIQNRRRVNRNYTKAKGKSLESNAPIPLDSNAELPLDSNARPLDSNAPIPLDSNAEPIEEKEKYQKKKEIQPYELSEPIEKDKGGTGGKDTPPPKRKIFIPPNVEEVAEYCRQRQNGIDPENFVFFYESKNWMIGKNRMVNWKAAIRTWERKRHEESNRNRPKRDYSGI